MAARRKKAEATTALTPTENVVVSIKGFGLDWKCQDFQYALGQIYTHTGVVSACNGGFSAIEGYPLEVFDYYAPGNSRYAEVRQTGELSRHEGDSTLASAKITIGVELRVHDLVERAVKWIVSQCKPADTRYSEGNQSAASSTGNRSAASSTGYQSAASSTGNQSAASSTGNRSAASSTGYQSAASSTGDRSAASSTGNRSAASSTGYQSAASSTGSAASSTGNRSAASSTGYQSAASSTGNQSAASSTGNRSAASSTGYQSAASSTGNQSAASSTGNRSAASSTGYQSAASSTGDRSAASSTGYQSAASSTGYQSAAMSSGVEGRVMGAEGCALFLVYRDPDTLDVRHSWAGIAGQNGIKPLCWYKLSSDGQPVETEQTP